MNGFAVSRWRSYSRSTSTSPCAAALEMVRPSSRMRWATATASAGARSSGWARASFASLGSRFSTVCRSARISSVFTVAMSDIGIDPAVDMDHVVVVKDADHLADGVTLPDGGQELVPQSFPL